MRTFVPLLMLAAAGGLVGAQSAHASLLYAPSASDTVLNATSSVDDTTYTPAGANAFALTGFTCFGVAQTAANFRVNNNGWVGFGNAYSTTTYGNVAMPFTSSTAGVTMIAPMWDDLYMTAPNTAVASQSVRVRAVDAGTYVVTWAHEEYFLDTAPDLTFQAILYGDGNGAGLASGTVIFCYDVLNAPAGDANSSFTIGINGGDGVKVAGLPGYAGATNNTTQLGTLANTGWTFTPNGSSYTVTQGKLPAPGAAALLGIGGLVVGRRRRN